MLDELYNDTIMDHGECSEFQGQLTAPAIRADAYNALCGDDISIYAAINDVGVIEEIKWDTETDACVISRASSSMLAESLNGKTIEFAKKLITDFKSLIRGKYAGSADALGDLSAFGALSHNPRRVKCAAMAWAALEDIVEQHESSESGDILTTLKIAQFQDLDEWIVGDA